MIRLPFVSKTPLSRGHFVALTAALTAGVVAALWTLGIGKLVTTPGIRYDRLAEVVFPIWNTRSVSSHGFAAATSIDAFDHHRVYTGHPPFMLLAWYGIAWASERFFPGTLGHSTNLFAFVYAAVLAGCFSWLAWSSMFTRGRWTLERSALFSLALAVLLTSRSLWYNLLVIHSDNPFPLVIYVLLLLVPFAAEQAPDTRRSATVGLGAFALVGPIYTPVVIASLVLILRDRIRDAGERVRLGLVGATALAVGMAGWFGPRIVAALLGNTTDNSTWAFRSGLDGDRQYLDGLWTAIVNPYVNYGVAQPGYLPRSGFELLGMPGAILAIAIVVACTRATWRQQIAAWLPVTALLLLSPYAFSAVFFAQSMTIHPYIYDYLLELPLSVMGIMTILHIARDAGSDPRVVGGFGWLLSAGLMANLISLAQAARLAIH